MFDEIGTRMKNNYESVSKYRLVRRMPVVIRVDGKAFHTFTKKFQKPFDDYLMCAMRDTMLAMCRQIQGCVFGYTQSDEITLILVDYKTLEQQAWFDNEVQKMCSISASLATKEFNSRFRQFVECNRQGMSAEQSGIYDNAIREGAMFDSRCFNVPVEELANLIYWRQQDAIRNSVEMVGRAMFSDKELFRKNTSDIKKMLMEKKINWDELPVYQQRGTACVRVPEEGEKRDRWVIDLNMPIIKGEDRAYVEHLIMPE